MTVSGGWAAAVTPSHDGEFQMDMAAALDVVEFLCQHKVAGIVLFGATGEFPHFTVEERQRLAHLAMKRSRVPVMVNVSHSNVRDVVALSEHAAESGAVGVLLQPPLYFRYRPCDIRAFYREVLDEIDGAVPVFLYHLPAFNNGVPLEVAEELLRDGLAAGIKDSSGDWTYFASLAALRRKYEFPLLVGNDGLLVRGLAAGADGFVSGCACAAPELLLAIEHAYRGGDQDRMSRLGGLLDEFLGWTDAFPGPYGVREALASRNLKVGARAVPFSEETEAQAARLREWFGGFLERVRRELV